MTGQPIAIVGPTASGKTTLALAVARLVDGEIISLDSRQAYAGMAVGTAAPTAADRAAVPHHGVGFLDPRERYGAGRFAALATGWLSEIAARGRVPILAGGTGLFLRALTHPMFGEPEADPVRRGALRAWIEALAPPELSRWAARLDAPGGRRTRAEEGRAPADPQRAARSLELVLLTGRPLRWWIEHGDPERTPLSAAVYALDVDAATLRGRIERRVDDWLDSGRWVAEVRRLREAGLHEAPAFDAIGYRDVLAMLEGDLTRDEVYERVVGDTWAYARRQRTWFRHQLPAGATRLDGLEATDQLARRIATGGAQRGPGR